MIKLSFIPRIGQDETLELFLKRYTKTKESISVISTPIIIGEGGLKLSKLIKIIIDKNNIPINNTTINVINNISPNPIFLFGLACIFVQFFSRYLEYHQAKKRIGIANIRE